MNANLRNFFDRRALDARFASRNVESRKCACCDEPGQFDPFFAVHDQPRQIALEREFGGACCSDCLDQFAPCSDCGEVKFATELDSEDGRCGDCRYNYEFAERRGW